MDAMDSLQNLLDEYMAALGPSVENGKAVWESRDSSPDFHTPGTYKGTIWNGNAQTALQDGGESSFASSECSSDSGLEPPCTMSLVERLIRSRPIWFLQELTRTGATHLLQGQDPGTFIVRGSTKAQSFALSVRLPPGKGPYIEHYLIEMRNKKLALETSSNLFDNIDVLIAHYSNCCDELPVQLKLPREILNAQSRQDLISLSHLGQEFWGRTKAGGLSPSCTEATTTVTSVVTSNANNVRHGNSSQSSLNSAPHLTSHSSLSSMSSFKSENQAWHANPLQQDIDNHNQKLIKPTSLPIRPEFGVGAERSPVGTPDTPPIVLNLKPIGGPKEPLVLSTFRTSPVGAVSPSPLTPVSTMQNSKVGIPPFHSPVLSSPSDILSPSNGSAFHIVSSSVHQKHVKTSLTAMANSNNSVVPLKKPILGQGPPPPPPRWSKSSVTSPSVSSPNFTFTTTVTLNLTPTSSASPIEVTVNRQSPDKCEAKIQVNQFDFINNGNEVSNKNNLKQITRPTSLNLSADSDNGQSKSGTPVTPNGVENGRQKVRKRRKSGGGTKRSYHYRECAIESPSTCYRSSLADKVSDYEDIWASSPPESSHSVTSPGFSTFKTPSPENKSDGIIRKVSTPLNTKELQSFTEAIQKLGEENGGLSPPDTDIKKNSSPCYADPVDALKSKAELVEQINRHSRLKNHRHSDPNIQWPQLLVDHPPLTTINSSEEVHNLSSSMDNLSSLKRNPPKFECLNKNARSQSTDLCDLNKQRCGSIRSKNGGLVVGKAVKPPIVSKNKNEGSWQVDSSWEFVAQEVEPGHLRRQSSGRSMKATTPRDGFNDSRFPVSSYVHSKSSSVITYTHTIEDMIFDKIPDVKVPDPRHSVMSTALRISDLSDYDNLFDRRNDTENPYHPSTVSDAPTEFSEPWDSSKWEPFIKMMRETSVSDRESSMGSLAPRSNEQPCSPDLIVSSTIDDSSARAGLIKFGGNRMMSDNDSVIHTTATGLIEDETSVDESPMKRDVKRSKSFQERMEPFLCPPRLQTLRKTRVDYDTGGSIRNYVLQLAEEKTSTFAQNIERFIQCTRESSEVNPFIMLRNVRQFMSGIKNYLIKHGEGDFINIVSRERNKLRSTEFLNLDAILEGCLHQLILPSLQPYLYQLFLQYHELQIKQLAGCIQLARSLTPQQLGLKPELGAVTESCLSVMRHFLERMEQVTSPLHKLENLLAAIAALFNTLSSGRRASSPPLSAEEFLPALVYSLAQVGLLGLEIEGEYTWGLLHSSLHAGEGGYYLAMLSGALHALKNIRPDNSPTQLAGLCSAAGFFRVSIPDEEQGTLVTHTLPVRPGMTCREITKMLAHRLRLTSTQDFALYKVVLGEESLLADGDSPQVIQTELTKKGIQVRFIYKRIDANLALPIDHLRSH